jgi:hypothetical protein
VNVRRNRSSNVRLEPRVANRSIQVAFRRFTLGEEHGSQGVRPYYLPMRCVRAQPIQGRDQDACPGGASAAFALTPGTRPDILLALTVTEC